ncbi:hypothetical protein AB0U74_18930 [Escherichia coli]
MKISQLESGMQVWSVTRTKMGNTTISTVIVHPVVIIEIHDNHVIARWNGNAPRRFGETAIRGCKTVSQQFRLCVGSAQSERIPLITLVLEAFAPASGNTV